MKLYIHADVLICSLVSFNFLTLTVGLPCYNQCMCKLFVVATLLISACTCMDTSTGQYWRAYFGSFLLAF